MAILANEIDTQNEYPRISRDMKILFSHNTSCRLPSGISALLYFKRNKDIEEILKFEATMNSTK